MVAKDTNAEQVSDTVKLHHQHITQPSLISDNRVLHVMQTLMSALQDAPTVACDAQLMVITTLQEFLQSWIGQNAVSRAQ